MGSSNAWRGLGGDHGYAGRSLGPGSEAIRLGQGWSLGSSGIVRESGPSPCSCRSGPAFARRRQGRGPPQQIVDHRPGGRIGLGQSSVDIAAFIVSPQGGDRDVDRRADGGELKLDHGFAELLHAARAPNVAVAHERRRLAIPLRIHPVDRVLEHGWGAVVVFRGDEDEAVGLSDGGGPFLYDLVLVCRAPPPGRRVWLLEEWHGKVAEVEQPRVDAVARLEVLQDPARGFFRETALAGASNDHGDDAHGLTLCSCAATSSGEGTTWEVLGSVESDLQARDGGRRTQDAAATRRRSIGVAILPGGSPEKAWDAAAPVKSKKMPA